ncbi:Guanine nucleotide binding protein (G-protein) domain containing protein [Aphelenchoides besseyi]|nr:Guanine nucleotide binding protein (G-protein) domain containing protein [Aphelenchoides besseyi]
MGLCHSEEEKQSIQVSKQIDKKLKEAHTAEEKVIKLLLLGAGECGKSTVMKQMRILHSNGFTTDEIYQQRSVVYSNTVHAMQELIKAMPKYKISFSDPSRFVSTFFVDSRAYFDFLARDFNDTEFEELKARSQFPWYSRFSLLTIQNEWGGSTSCGKNFGLPGNLSANFRLDFKFVAKKEDAQLVMQVIKSGDEMEPFSPQLGIALKRLWADPAISDKTYGHRLDFHLHESAKHFLDSLDRLANPSYQPSEQDILLTRIKTTGIVEVEFQIKGVQFRVFDVGGQRSERKKWIHAFEDVNAVIFVAAVSEYDEVLFEDETTNRIIESMRLFESICNSRWFINTSMILFLNKKDLFAEKIQHYSIKKAFPDYSGPQTYSDSIAFIKKKFEVLNSNPRKTVYVHETCATDTNQVQLILDSVISMIIQANLHKSGLY